MAAPFQYTTIAAPVQATFMDRGSRFIAYASPLDSIEAFKSTLAALKKEHPKAAHHCIAYRIGQDGQTFRVSDDGEPSGSAGRPILAQIDQRGLTNVAVIVVRYFGGTLLGVPGLIHAYRTVTAAALDQATIVTEPVRKLYRIQFDYTQLNDIMRLIKQAGCKIIRQEAQLFCLLEVAIPVEAADSITARLSDWKNCTIEPVN